MDYETKRVPWNKGIPHTPEVCRKMSEAKKGQPGHPHTDEFKARMSKRTGSNNPFHGRKHSEASKKKMSLKRKDRKLSQVHCKAISNGLKGHDTPDWVRERISEGVRKYYRRNGLGIVRTYPEEFNAILKRKIMCRDGFQCRNPGCKSTDKGRRLGLHHINYDKQDCRDENLITLCRSCNTRANYVSRHLWMLFYQFIVEEIIERERLAA